MNKNRRPVESAVADKSGAQSGRMAATKRLQKELMDFVLNSDTSMTAFPDGDNLFRWIATITGPKDTVFDGLKFKLMLTFSAKYPSKALSSRLSHSLTTRCLHIVYQYIQNRRPVESAVADKSLSQSGRMAATKRLQKELMDFVLNSDTSMTAFPDGDNLFSSVLLTKGYTNIHSAAIFVGAQKKKCSPILQSMQSMTSCFVSNRWIATITGPKDTVFDGLKFKLMLTFSAKYPFCAPIVVFVLCGQSV
ncbi:unnamed protein product [Medioppia subpectinata]|uniref:UBC core domain-containing protein n=1 Tax=Medioppia subpectinata TaxID=1979941 RepID=A0A7R9Q8C9_9ACAR|nr:unnamed protein product [Medioppia subpectinata]CAG2116641.1 unnamed protein product [Medioppia subpectinata]